MVQATSGVPVKIKLVDLVNVTGWSVSGGIAIHSSCSAGDLRLKNVSLLPSDYEITYNVKSVLGGVLKFRIGATEIRSITQPGFYVDHVIGGAGKQLNFSAGIGTSVEITSFTFKKTAVAIDETSESTIAYSEQVDKWTSFYTYNPDYGFSLKGNLFTLKQGALYKHDISCPRNTFYGIEYRSRVKFPMNQALNVIKNFQNIEVQSNKLLVTTEDGLQTSLGQVSDLIAEDFKQFNLTSGPVSVDVYDLEGVYQAKFLRDKHTDIIEGDRLKGSFMTIELTTTDDQDFKLYRVYVNAEPSASGI